MYFPCKNTIWLISNTAYQNLLPQWQAAVIICGKGETVLLSPGNTRGKRSVTNSYLLPPTGTNRQPPSTLLTFCFYISKAVCRSLSAVAVLG